MPEHPSNWDSLTQYTYIHVTHPHKTTLDFTYMVNQSSKHCSWKHESFLSFLLLFYFYFLLFDSGNYSDQSSKQFLKTWKFLVSFFYYFVYVSFFFGGGDSGKYSDQSSKQFLKTWKFPVFFFLFFFLRGLFWQWKVLSIKRSDDKYLI